MLAILEGHIFMVVHNHWNSGLNNWTEIFGVTHFKGGVLYTLMACVNSSALGGKYENIK